MNRRKIVITGGHHNSALVVAKELLSLGHGVEWIGHRYASAGDRNDSAEYIEVHSAGIPFHNLVAGKTSFAPSNLLNIPLGLLRARKMLISLRPDAILSFGGYLGLSVSLAAFSLGIPVFLHEQTVIAGKANKLAARFAKKIYLTWPSSAGYYPSSRSRVIGLPLRPTFLLQEEKNLFPGRRPSILFLCGKLGSHTINKIIFAHLEELLLHYNLIHQTGTSSMTGDYEKALALKESLPPELSGRYFPRGYIGENDIAGIMQNVDLVIGRSGAHTAYELGILGKKSILIPFLSTHGREQLHNARTLEKAGIAAILPQSELSFPKLEHEITLVLKRAEPKPLELPLDAATKLIEDLLASL